jgi:nucleoside phosphorylase
MNESGATPPPPEDVSQRKEIARLLLDAGTEAIDLELEPVLDEEAGLLADLGIPFPQGLAPDPQPIDPVPDRSAPLPEADVVAITWTVAELNALADVLTPGYPRTRWYRYTNRYEDHFLPQIRDDAPARKAQRLASWFPTKIGDKSVLCMKSELHLNQDGISTGDGTATLPVKDLFRQIIDQVKPELVLTVGTSGGVKHEHDLGDVVVTRGAKFRLSDEFAKEPFAGKVYKSDWRIPTEHFAKAEELMARHAGELVEPDFAPPTKRYPFEGPLLKPDPPNDPSIILDDGTAMPEFHPILTTDFFEFGTSANNLWTEGCAVEMGDAVLGLVCEELGDAAPKWAIVRNLSDPMINGDLPNKPRKLDMQAHWAVWYYEAYGYWTSVMGALATWAIIAGLDEGSGG